MDPNNGADDTKPQPAAGSSRRYVSYVEDVSDEDDYTSLPKGKETDHDHGDNGSSLAAVDGDDASRRNTDEGKVDSDDEFYDDDQDHDTSEDEGPLYESSDAESHEKYGVQDSASVKSDTPGRWSSRKRQVAVNLGEPTPAVNADREHLRRRTERRGPFVQDSRLKPPAEGARRERIAPSPPLSRRQSGYFRASDPWNDPPPFPNDTNPSYASHGYRRPPVASQHPPSVYYRAPPPPPQPLPGRPSRYGYGPPPLAILSEHSDLESAGEYGWQDHVDGNRFFEQVEQEDLSISLSVKRNKDTLTVNTGMSREESLAWKQPTTRLSKGASTELHIIHASEYSVDETGRGVLTLVCPDGPRRDDADSSSVQMRWLYVPCPTLEPRLSC